MTTHDSQHMTSLEIAEVTGKPHCDVLKAIRKMEDAWARVNGGKFSLVEYRDQKGELRPCYSLTKTECLYIATKFNDEARARLIIRWQQLERQRVGELSSGMQERLMHQGIRKLLVTDGDVMNEAERIVGRTLTANNKHADGCITTTDIARGFGMETRDLNAFLTDKGVQRWKRGQFRLTPDFEGRGLAQDRLFIYYSKDRKQKERTYLVWTQKGADFINEEIKRKN